MALVDKFYEYFLNLLEQKSFLVYLWNDLYFSYMMALVLTLVGDGDWLFEISDDWHSIEFTSALPELFGLLIFCVM